MGVSVLSLLMLLVVIQATHANEPWNQLKVDVAMDLLTDNGNFQTNRIEVSISEDVNNSSTIDSFCLGNLLSIEDCNVIRNTLELKQRREKKGFIDKQGLEAYKAMSTAFNSAESNAILSKSVEADYVLVTFFYDIGAADWASFQKLPDVYIHYLALLCHSKANLIVYLDDRYEKDLKAEMEELEAVLGSPSKGLIIIPINETFLEQQIPSWGYRSRMEAIMQSPEYRAKAALREEKDTPETLHADYNAINFAKIDFVAYTVEHLSSLWPFSSRVSHVGWVDSGYIRDVSEIPSYYQPIAKMKNDKINVFLHGTYFQSLAGLSAFATLTRATEGASTGPSAIIKQRIDAFNFTDVFVKAAVDIPGAFWFLSLLQVPLFKRQFHLCTQAMLDQNIADDDQSVLMCCWLSDEDSFKPWRTFKLLGWTNEYQGSFLSFFVLNKAYSEDSLSLAFIEQNMISYA